MTSLRHNDHADRVDSVPGPHEAYLDAARACLLDVGWRRTTLTEVARRAGVSRMTIYRSWPDMGALLGDLMTREWTDLVRAAVADADPALPRVERLVATITTSVRGLRSNELFVRIVELDPELILPYLLARRGRSQNLVLGVVEAEVVAGQDAGEVRAGDATAIARGLLLAVHGFALSAQTMLDDSVDEAAIDAELELLLTRSLAP